MVIHHSTLLMLLVKAATRLEQAGQPNDQLVALIREVEAVSEQAEAADATILKLLDQSIGFLGDGKKPD